MVRPRGVNGELVLQGRARDLLTPRTGDPVIIGAATMDVRIDFMDERRVRWIRTTPEIAGLEELVGRGASSGFRRGLDAVAAAHRDQRSLLYLLLSPLAMASTMAWSARRESATAVRRGSPARACKIRA